MILVDREESLIRTKTFTPNWHQKRSIWIFYVAAPKPSGCEKYMTLGSNPNVSRHANFTDEL